ncbi:MAG: TetM/TetW/TetO/TetS family tetracycline resistance ribosomal protection protein [Eubacteriales bacterium]|nr:TetM/TetW/TetO/TetS family tetracycline resistance ribosomal protection protein [Lachnospiraceae bacterium]MDO5128185.1 TetM/TetW/TetO/TetS family tetracycline resistance ribosomal protection protein [Eubacteriales bacterium]
MKNIVVGVLAHVDAGKTTLSEAILYETGVRKMLGRVDNKNTLFDHDEFERSRGITIFSKQAQFDTANYHITWLDTPGHVDFSAEMERTLQVLDYAILLISASDGVTGHTRTLWSMLKQYNIPTFIFVNKIDQPDCYVDSILLQLQKELSEGCICFSDGKNETFQNYYEELCMLTQNEQVLERYLVSGSVDNHIICENIKCRHVFPCYFGSALRNEGIRLLINGLNQFLVPTNYSDQFGAKIYKITRDEVGTRLTHLKITGGRLLVKELVSADEKVNEIRIYAGDSYQTVQSVCAGQICAITGPKKTYSGQGLGIDSDNKLCLSEPVLTYQMLLPDGMSARQIYPEMKQIAEEMPELRIEWNDVSESIHVRLMGQMQIDVLTGLVNRRFGFTPSFDMGTITYMETITDTVIGVGHYEPLKHYAEVHLRMEPGERGSGITVLSDCSVDVLEKNWQRLIMTHLLEKSYAGVLTGAKLTDVKITVINGRAHQKHTEGGDFRQATYRAVRQGLMQATCILLEPYYDFVLDIPSELIGKAMTDIDAMHGKVLTPSINGERATLRGYGPVSTMRDYQKQLAAFTHGTGSMYVTLRGYERCHNEEEIIGQIGYHPDEDINNPSSSVFCSHGSGYLVPWYEVFQNMHVVDEQSKDGYVNNKPIVKSGFNYTIDLEEIDQILSRTFQANRKDSKHPYTKKKMPIETQFYHKNIKKRNKLLIVDGYNVIFAWEDLRELSKANIDSAKDRLIHVLSNYQGICEQKIMLVFDGYKRKGNIGSMVSLENITVIHTKEDMTADHFIEKFNHEHAEEYEITVASSDGMIQQIVRGANGWVISSRDLLQKIEDAFRQLRETYDIETI